MAGEVVLQTAESVNQIEAPVTWKAYLICAFASFGGIYFGYDSGYINGVLGSSEFIRIIEGPDATALTSSNQSLIVSILSAGTFFGALVAGDVAEFIGRKWTVIMGCGIYMVGVVIQMITGPGRGLAPIVAGRLVAGVGVGFESAIVILYMSEIVRPSFLSFVPQLTDSAVSQKSPRRCRLGLPVVYHYRPSSRFLCRLRNGTPNRLWFLPYSHCHSVCLGAHPWWRVNVFARFPQVFRQKRPSPRRNCLIVQAPWSTT